MKTCRDCKYWRHWLDYGKNEGCTNQVLPGDDEPGECDWSKGKAFPLAWQHAFQEVTGVNSDQDAADCACFEAKG